MSHLYRVIVKTGEKHRSGEDRFVRYNTSDLLKFTDFMDRSFPSWRWFNVYKYQKNRRGYQVGSFTRKSRPLTSRIRH